MSRPGATGSAYPSARDQAAWQTCEHIQHVALTVFGATEVYESLPSASSVRGPVLDEPLAGVLAARLVGDVAAGQLREWALRARGLGRDWGDVAAALGLPARDGEAAWEWLIEHRPPAPGPEPWGARPASAVWTCTTCGARVRDNGPYASHPDDRETGHATGCSRHADAVAAWRRDAGFDHAIPDHDHHETDR